MDVTGDAAPLPASLASLAGELDALGGGDARAAPVDVTALILGGEGDDTDGSGGVSAAGGRVAGSVDASESHVVVREPGPRAGVKGKARRFRVNRAVQVGAAGPAATAIHAGVADAAVAWVWDGFNATVLALGAGGTGKTSALFGNPHDAPPAAGDGSGSGSGDSRAGGLIRRAVELLLLRISAAEAGGEDAEDYTLAVSMWELRCDDTVVDLMAPSESGGPTQASSSLRFAAVQLPVSDVAAAASPRSRPDPAAGHKSPLAVATDLIFHVARARSANRGGRPAHTFIRLLLHNGAKQRVSTLHIVDLVGVPSLGDGVDSSHGHRISKAERSVLAKQHLALGRVVAELADEAVGSAALSAGAHSSDSGGFRLRSARDTKLTQIVAPLLAGNNKTWMLSCLSGRGRDSGATLTTLRLAVRARDITCACVRLLGVTLSDLAIVPIDTALAVGDSALRGGSATISETALESERRGGRASEGAADGGSPAVKAGDRDDGHDAAGGAEDTGDGNGAAHTAARSLAWLDDFNRRKAQILHGVEEVVNESPSGGGGRRREDAATPKNIEELRERIHDVVDDILREPSPKPAPEQRPGSVDGSSVSSDSLDGRSPAAEHRGYAGDDYRRLELEDIGDSPASARHQRRSERDHAHEAGSDTDDGGSDDGYGRDSLSLHRDGAQHARAGERRGSGDYARYAEPTTGVPPSLPVPEFEGGDGPPSGPPELPTGDASAPPPLPPPADLPRDPEVALVVAREESTLLRRNYESLLQLLRAEQTARAKHAAWASELEARLAETTTTYELRLDDSRVAVLEARGHARKAAARSGFGSLFEELETALESARSELLELRVENAELEVALSDALNGEQPSDGEGSEQHAPSQSFVSTGASSALVRAGGRHDRRGAPRRGTKQSLRRRLRAATAEAAEARAQADEAQHRERVHALNRRCLEDALKKLNRQERELSAAREELQSMRLSTAALEAKVDTTSTALEKAEARCEALVAEREATSEELAAMRRYVSSMNADKRRRDVVAFARKPGRGALSASPAAATKRADRARSAAQGVLAKATREARSTAPHLMALLSQLEKELGVLDDARHEGLQRENELLDALAEMVEARGMPGDTTVVSRLAKDLGAPGGNRTRRAPGKAAPPRGARAGRASTRRSGDEAVDAASGVDGAAAETSAAQRRGAAEKVGAGGPGGRTRPRRNPGYARG